MRGIWKIWTWDYIGRLVRQNELFSHSVGDSSEINLGKVKKCLIFR